MYILLYVYIHTYVYTYIDTFMALYDTYVINIKTLTKFLN